MKSVVFPEVDAGIKGGISVTHSFIQTVQGSTTLHQRFYSETFPPSVERCTCLTFDLRLQTESFALLNECD